MSELVARLSLFHLDVLLLLGLALFGGTIGGRLFQKMKIPQVVAYVIIGILLGQTGTKIIDARITEALQPFNYFALGLIGFMIGGELKKQVLLRYGKHFLCILLFEGVMSFLVVSVLVIVVLGGTKLAWSLGLLLGAIASATAPAAHRRALGV